MNKFILIIGIIFTALIGGENGINKIATIKVVLLLSLLLSTIYIYNNQ